MSGQCIRVLIVDDEPTVAMVLAESLERLSKGYIIDTAGNANQALEKISQNNYALMITDYRLPGLNGLDLAVAARRSAPQMLIVLMTAYGTERLRDAADEVGLDGYINKPFTMTQIRQIVQNAIQQTETSNSPLRSRKDQLERPVYEQLKALQANTGARCIMLVSASGYPIETSGQTDGIDVTSVGALVAANFMAAAELGRKLGKGSVFKSSYHEGQGDTDYNLYAYDVNGELLLVVVFGAESKTGAVWFYTKQAASCLASMVGQDVITAALPVSPAGMVSEMSEATPSQNNRRQPQCSSGSLTLWMENSPDDALEDYLSEELDKLLRM